MEIEALHTIFTTLADTELDEIERLLNSSGGFASFRDLIRVPENDLGRTILEGS